MAVLAVNFTTWTLSLNMTGQISSLYHLHTLIGIMYFLKLTTITVTKVIVDAIQFSLPLTTFHFVSTAQLKTFNFSINSLITNSLSRQIGQALLIAAAFLTLPKQDLQNK